MRVITFKGRGISGPIINSINFALKEMGHQVNCIEAKKLKVPYASSKEVLEKLITEIRGFAPQLALFYGIYGIIPVDTSHGKSTLFDILKVPYASLFFDDPFISLPIYSQYRNSSFYHIFVFDRIYLDRLHSLGFRRLHHLHIGTDPAIFKKIELDDVSREKYSSNLSFVGHIFPKEEFEEERSDWNPFLNRVIDETVRLKLENFSLPVLLILSEIAKSLPIKERKDFEAFLYSKSSPYFLCQIYKEIDSLYRKGFIDALPLPVDAYGGEEFISDKIRLKGKIDYEKELPKLYNATAINLNITTSQSITSPTQRIFDVSACGAFVLTDHRPGIEELFKVGEEIICYRTPEELKDLVRYYLDHSDERKVIAQRAHTRTLKEHTYKERMKTVLEVVGGTG